MQEINAKTVYLVRHGQSTDNTALVFQSPNSPLSKTGQIQAMRIADRVSKLEFDTLISSPFVRAKQTAEAIHKRTGKIAIISELFAERIKPSSINGKPYNDKVANLTWKEWEKSLYTPGTRTEDGENYDDIITRADCALDYLKKRSEKTLLVVSHGYFLRTILARVLLGNLLSHESFRSIQCMASMENTGLTLLKFHQGTDVQPNWRLLIYNDHSHLSD